MAKYYYGIGDVISIKERYCKYYTTSELHNLFTADSDEQAIAYVTNKMLDTNNKYYHIFRDSDWSLSDFSNHGNGWKNCKPITNYDIENGDKKVEKKNFAIYAGDNLSTICIPTERISASSLEEVINIVETRNYKNWEIWDSGSCVFRSEKKEEIKMTKYSFYYGNSINESLFSKDKICGPFNYLKIEASSIEDAINIFKKKNVDCKYWEMFEQDYSGKGTGVIASNYIKDLPGYEEPKESKKISYCLYYGDKQTEDKTCLQYPYQHTFIKSSSLDGAIESVKKMNLTAKYWHISLDKIEASNFIKDLPGYEKPKMRRYFYGFGDSVIKHNGHYVSKNEPYKPFSDFEAESDEDAVKFVQNEMKKNNRKYYHIYYDCDFKSESGGWKDVKPIATNFDVVTGMKLQTQYQYQYHFGNELHKNKVYHVVGIINDVIDNRIMASSDEEAIKIIKEQFAKSNYKYFNIFSDKDYKKNNYSWQNIKPIAANYIVDSNVKRYYYSTGSSFIVEGLNYLVSGEHILIENAKTAKEAIAFAKKQMILNKHDHYNVFVGSPNEEHDIHSKPIAADYDIENGKRILTYTFFHGDEVEKRHTFLNKYDITTVSGDYKSEEVSSSSLNNAIKIFKENNPNVKYWEVWHDSEIIDSNCESRFASYEKTKKELENLFNEIKLENVIKESSKAKLATDQIITLFISPEPSQKTEFVIVKNRTKPRIEMELDALKQGGTAVIAEQTVEAFKYALVELLGTLYPNEKEDYRTVIETPLGKMMLFRAFAELMNLLPEKVINFDLVKMFQETCKTKMYETLFTLIIDHAQLFAQQGSNIIAAGLKAMPKLKNDKEIDDLKVRVSNFVENPDEMIEAVTNSETAFA